MWCPSVSLSVWANAWLAGAAAPDDVLDALSHWAPTHLVTAYDSVAAGRTGLPWPELADSGSMSLLQTVRGAAGPISAGPPMITVVQPVPGDVRGLPAGTQFQQDAIATGEAVIIAGADSVDAAVGLVPEFEFDTEFDTDDDDDGAAPPSALSWTVYSLPVAPQPEHVELGEAEYALRSAVRSAAEALGVMQVGAADSEIDDPRELVEQILDAHQLHLVPDHAPTRALRVLETAAHVDAIITVSSGLMPIGLQSSEFQLASNALRPLAGVVRTARMAAASAIIRSAWQ